MTDTLGRMARTKSTRKFWTWLENDYLPAVTGQATAAVTAELDVLAAVTPGTIVASKAVVVGASKQVNEWFITGTSVEPMVFSSTLTGIGGVGGRARFQLDTNVALGGWSNALKAITVYGAAGRTTDLGSAFVAEMTMSAGTTVGTYAPLEIELNMGASGKTGTATSLIYASVNDAAATVFDDNGFLFNIAGLTDGAAHVLYASTKTGIAKTHTLRIKVGATTLYIPCHTDPACGGS